MRKLLLIALVAFGLNHFPANATTNSKETAALVDKLIDLISLCRNEGEIAEAGAMSGKGLLDLNQVLALAEGNENIKQIIMTAYNDKGDPKETSLKQFNQCVDRIRDVVKQSTN